MTTCILSQENKQDKMWERMLCHVNKTKHGRECVLPCQQTVKDLLSCYSPLMQHALHRITLQYALWTDSLNETFCSQSSMHFTLQHANWSLSFSVSIHHFIHKKNCFWLNYVPDMWPMATLQFIILYSKKVKVFEISLKNLKGAKILKRSYYSFWIIFVKVPLPDFEACMYIIQLGNMTHVSDPQSLIFKSSPLTICLFSNLNVGISSKRQGENVVHIVSYDTRY
jgi:hypothetical protein